MSDGEFQIPQEILDLLSQKEGLFPERRKSAKSYLHSLVEKTRKHMTGIELIAQERLEHKVKHHKSIKSDYQLYPDYELSTLAQAVIDGNLDKAPDCFSGKWLELLMRKSYPDRLIVAGALIAAEIDRLNYEE